MPSIGVGLGLATVLSGGILSYNYDFSTQPDGSLPAGLSGSTWSITSGQASNNPTLGSELLTDPSLEATYTAGKCNTLTATGSPTVAESADAHAGSKAQQFTGVAINNALNFTSVGSLTGKWLQFNGWGKRTVGTASLSYIEKAQNGFPGGFQTDRIVKDAAYTQKVQVFKAFAATCTVYAAACANGGTDTVITDDFSLKEITAAEMFATRSYPQADAAMRLYLDFGTSYNGCLGLVARLDSDGNPQNYILVGVEVHAQHTSSEKVWISMAKVVGGTLTVLIAATSLAALPVNGDYIDLVSNGDGFSMYYNGVQKGTTQTVTGMTGTLFGFFGAGGPKVNRFFLGASL